LLGEVSGGELIRQEGRIITVPRLVPEPDHHQPARRRRARKRVLLGALALVLLGLGVLWHGGWLASSPGPRPPHGPYIGSVARPRATVWALGDGADGSAASRALARRIRAAHPDRVLYLGDVYGPSGLIDLLTRDGTHADFEQRYATAYGRLADRTAPTPGNHEWALRSEGYDPYWTGVYGSTPPDYYAFSVAGWRILSLNSQAPHDPGSPQLRWLHAQLRAPGTCRIAYWHRPRFSAGRHGDQPDVAPLWGALIGHATIVLNGHDHDLQQLRPISGLTELVDGAGGASRYGLHQDRRLAFGDDHNGAAIRLTLRRGAARWAFVTTDGRKLDSGQVPCRP
jgi:hypothetical protein